MVQAMGYGSFLRLGTGARMVTRLFPSPVAAGVGVMKQIVEHQSNELKARLD